MTNCDSTAGEMDEDPEVGCTCWRETSDSAVTHEIDEPAQGDYDLEERTAQFGERVIHFAKRIPHSPVNNRLIDQLVGAATSVGANCGEADDGVSRADFRHRIGICRKEARETKFFCAWFQPRCQTSNPRLADFGWKRAPGT